MVKERYVWTDTLIALINILDDYEPFLKNLDELFKYGDVSDTLGALSEVSKGEEVFNPNLFMKFFQLGRIKKFYQENKAVIDTVNQSFDNKLFHIGTFISFIYDDNGVIKENGLNYFYNYYMNHKDKLDQILALLRKLKSLGFPLFRFDEEADFTKKQHIISRRFEDDMMNMEVTYLDNIVVDPSYQSNVVKYRTTGSNYEISVRSKESSDGVGGKIYLLNDPGRCTLNNLLFDYHRLPEQLSKECTYDKIVDLKEKQLIADGIVRYFVDLGLLADEFEDLYETICKIVNDSKYIDKQDQLREILLNMKTYLDQLKTISSQYEDVTPADTAITKETIEKEMYLRRLARDFDAHMYTQRFKS